MYIRGNRIKRIDSLSVAITETVYNTAPGNTVYIHNTGTTKVCFSTTTGVTLANGFELAAGEKMLLPIEIASNLYLIATTTPSIVKFLVLDMI